MIIFSILRTVCTILRLLFAAGPCKYASKAAREIGLAAIPIPCQHDFLNLKGSPIKPGMRAEICLYRSMCRAGAREKNLSALPHFVDRRYNLSAHRAKTAGLFQ